VLIVFNAEFLWDQAFSVWNTRAGMLHMTLGPRPIICEVHMLMVSVVVWV